MTWIKTSHHSDRLSGRVFSAALWLGVLVLGSSVAVAQLDDNAGGSGEAGRSGVGGEPASGDSEGFTQAAGQSDDSFEPKQEHISALMRAESLQESVNRAIRNAQREIADHRKRKSSEVAVVDCLMGVLTREGGGSMGLNELRGAIGDELGRMRPAASDPTFEGDRDKQIATADRILFGADGGGGYQLVLRRLEDEASVCQGKNNDPDERQEYLVTDEAKQAADDFQAAQDRRAIGVPDDTGSLGQDIAAQNPGVTQVPPAITEI